MADDSDNNSSRGSDMGRAASRTEQARDLIDAALDGRLSGEQRNVFEQLVVTHPTVAELYVEMVHLSCCLPFHVLHTVFDSNAAGREAREKSAFAMNETMILPALRESDLGDDNFEQQLPGPISSLAPKPGVSKLQRWMGGSAAAVLVIGISVLWSMHGREAAPTGLMHRASPVVVAAKPPAMITATAAIAADQSKLAVPGTALATDQTFQLADGAAEVTFASGAVAVVRGPARLRIIDQNSVALQTGSISVHVPSQATGFRVNSPGLSVVDLGTNFGVLALADGTGSEVHVFGGKVDAGAVDATGRLMAPVIHMIDGDAVRHEVASLSAPVPIVFAPAVFTRDIAEVKTTIPMHNTGDQATPGGADPNWQIVSSPADPNWQARPAMVPRDLLSMYTKFVAAGSWIAVDAKMDDQPVGIFTFRTKVDLTGFDPASVAIIADVAADDYVTDIRVNGISTGLSTDSKLNLNGHQKSELAIPATFWRVGVNQVEVLVMNKPINFKPNCMALHVDWAASGVAVVHR